MHLSKWAGFWKEKLCNIPTQMLLKILKKKVPQKMGEGIFDN